MKNEDKTVLVGQVLQCDKTLPSGNKYPKSVVEKAVKEFNKQLKEDKKSYGRLIGDISHPDDLPTDELTTISHKVNAVELKDNGKVFAELELLPTKDGIKVENIVKSLEGVPFRAVARGIGDLNGYKEVLNFEITSVDIAPENAITENSLRLKKNKKLF